MFVGPGCSCHWMLFVRYLILHIQEGHEFWEAKCYELDVHPLIPSLDAESLISMLMVFVDGPLEDD